MEKREEGREEKRKGDIEKSGMQGKGERRKKGRKQGKGGRMNRRKEEKGKG